MKKDLLRIATLFLIGCVIHERMPMVDDAASTASYVLTPANCLINQNALSPRNGSQVSAKLKPSIVGAALCVSFFAFTALGQHKIVIPVPDSEYVLPEKDVNAVISDLFELKDEAIKNLSALSLLNRTRVLHALVEKGLTDPLKSRRIAARLTLVHLAMQKETKNIFNADIRAEIQWAFDRSPVDEMLRRGAVGVMLQMDVSWASSQLIHMSASYPDEAKNLLVDIVKYATIQDSEKNNMPADPFVKNLFIRAGRYINRYSANPIRPNNPNRHFLKLVLEAAHLMDQYSSESSVPLETDVFKGKLDQLLNEAEFDDITSPTEPFILRVIRGDSSRYLIAVILRRNT